MDNSAQGHPMFITDDTAKLSARVKELEDMVMTGQRLLTVALEQKAVIKANEQRLLEQNVAMWKLLRRVRDSRFFWLLPRSVREAVATEAGNAN